jgi:hypothetical protein
VAVTFTVTDNANGTGVTAVVAGSGALDVNDFFGARATGLTGPLVPTLYGSRVGNGAIVLPLPLGLWFLYLSSAGVLAQTSYVSSSDSALAVATRCRRSVCDTIRLLTIPPASRVYEQSFPDPQNVAFPCVLVTVDGVSETDESGLSTRDDVGRPVKVQIADRRSKSDHAKLPDYELWRQAIERCFRNQQLAGVPESKICRIEPYVILDANLPQFEYMVSGLVVRAVCREPRGVGV